MSAARNHFRHPVPILILGDSPSLPTGLGRIVRDIAVGLARMPEFRVGTLGRGGMPDRRLPFIQYCFEPSAESQWGEAQLADAWVNFAGDERGIVFTIWDPSRLTWFGHPRRVAGTAYERLYDLLTSDRFERWGYFAVDAPGVGPGGALTNQIGETLAGYDRVLAYSKFGRDILTATACEHFRRDDVDGWTPEIDWAPHGINTRVFKPRDRAEARRRMRLLASITADNSILASADDGTWIIGCVMSNQPRKDWGLWAATARQIVNQESGRPILFWAHTDSLDRYWDIRRLCEDLRLEGRVVVTLDTPSDEEMAWRYSACDATFLPSLGEGFGYPIAESMACGVPCVHGLGAGAELLPATFVVSSDRGRLDTRWNVIRPVYEDSKVAAVLLRVLGCNRDEDGVQYLRDRVAHLEWSKLWPSVWRKWLLRGIGPIASRLSQEVAQ